MQFMFWCEPNQKLITVIQKEINLPCDLEEDILTVGWLGWLDRKTEKSFNKLQEDFDARRRSGVQVKTVFKRWCKSLEANMAEEEEGQAEEEKEEEEEKMRWREAKSRSIVFCNTREACRRMRGREEVVVGASH